MLRLICFLIILLPISWTYSQEERFENPHPANVYELKKAQWQRLIKPFTGTYSVSNTFHPFTSLGLIRLHGTEMCFWQQVAGNMSSCSFQLNLDMLNQEIKTPHSYELHTLEDNVAQIVKIQFSSTNKTEEYATLTVDKNEIFLTRTRKHFKRKFLFYGPWVPDTTSYIAKVDTLDIKLNLLKLSSTPLSLKQFLDIIDNSTSLVVRTTKSFSSMSELSEIFKEGHFELLEEDVSHLYITEEDTSVSESNVVTVNFGTSNECATYLSLTH